MWFIPNGIFHKAPGLSIGLYIWKGIIPAGLGNIVGGGLFVACLFWYLHLQGEPQVAIDGIYYDQIPAQELHLAERGEHSTPDSLDTDGRKTSPPRVEGRV